MGTVTVSDIIKATGGKIIYGNPDAVFTGISIDSRTIGKTELFVPLKGRNFDGHKFLIDALRRGGGALVSIPPAEPVKGMTMVFVKNTLKALQDIAHYERMKRAITVVGITGTNGKTTTKELTASILGMSHRVLKTSGNLNNQIGLPLGLVRIADDDEFAVLEMGASMRGDIRELCGIAVPDLGVITNVGLGHIEGFGSLEAVRSTKLELLETVKTIALNADDAFLMEGIHNKSVHRDGLAIVTFGIASRADVSAQDIVLGERHSVFTLSVHGKRLTEVRLNVPGKFNIYNALAAASLCSATRIKPAEIKEGIESFIGVPMRLELKEFMGATIISDVYNANPLSMEEAVKELVRLRRSRAIAVLGDMLELGSYAEEAHRKLGRWMAGIPVDVLIAAGPLMEKAAEEFSAGRGKSITVSDSSGAGDVLREICREGDTVLVKGSRGMQMELVLEGHHGRSPVSAQEAGNAL